MKGARAPLTLAVVAYVLVACAAAEEGIHSQYKSLARIDVTDEVGEGFGVGVKKSPAGWKQHRIWRSTPGLMPQAMHPRCTRRTGRRSEKRSVNPGNVPSRTAASTSGPTRRASRTTTSCNT